MNLSAQVHELEKRLESLEYENQDLKLMLYRMIASNDKGVELVPYSDTKEKMITHCEFYMRQNVPHVQVAFMKNNVEPNNSESDL